MFTFRPMLPAALVAPLAAICVAGCGSISHAARDLSGGAVAPASVGSTRPIDGGSHYFARLSPRSAWMDGHILIGAWLEQPQSLREVRSDRALGENIYWNLAAAPGQGRADYNVIRAGGMHVSAPDTSPRSGAETVAYDGTDESDMNYGAGWSGFYHPDSSNFYTKDDCIPQGSNCGYTVARLYYNGDRTGVDPRQSNPGYPTGTGTTVHQGYGKGVLFWYSDQQAAEFLKYSDILSADVYWLTDSDARAASQGGCALRAQDPVACGGGGGSGLTPAQAALPANYAFNVTELERLQALEGPPKPVVVDVETGCPGSSGACATPPESIAAAWHALIAGARGIIWFQHNFSGPCIDDRTFLDGSNPASGMYSCQQTPGVTLHRLVLAISRFDHEVGALSPVLLAPTLQHYARVRGVVSLSAKAYRGSCYLFVGAGRPATPPPPNQLVTFTVAGHFTGSVAVVDEHRSLRAGNGVFRDRFAGSNTVHVYRLRGPRCA